MSSGFQILPRVVTPRALVRLFEGRATSHISDSMGRMTGSIGLSPRHAGGHMVGTALTVRTRPGDNLLIHRALQLGAVGDVLVVDGVGDLERGLVGEIMKCVAQSRGFAGFVIDGAIRDLDAFANDRFPCYSRAVSHRGPYKNGPGEINVPVSVGGMVVHPGDILVGDADGVVAIRPEYAEAVATESEAIAGRESLVLDAIARRQYDDSWIAKSLADAGYSS